MDMLFVGGFLLGGIVGSLVRLLWLLPTMPRFHG